MTTASAGLIDPSKHAEYPILLGDKLAGKESARDTRFVNVAYNHKSKGGSPQQKTVITRGPSEGFYNLTIQDKAGDAGQTPLTYKYRGGTDPNGSGSFESEYGGGLCLVFDPKRKAFILEPVSTRLNFNLRSAPGKSDQQVAEQYPQLSTLLDEVRTSNDGRTEEDHPTSDEPDESNPFDYRHFLPKNPRHSEAGKPRAKSPSIPALDLDSTTSRPPTTKPTPSQSSAAKKQKPKSKPKASSQANPLRQQEKKRTPKPAPPPKPEEDVPIADAALPEEELTGQKSEQPPAASPNSNIIVDGDLIIDMGSPPPQRPAFKINPRHFSSNNTPENNAGYGSDEDEELEDPRLPSPAIHRPSPSQQRESGKVEADDGANEDASDGGDAADDEEPRHTTQTYAGTDNFDDDDDDDDDLAAEIKAAFEQGAREEEQNRHRELQRMQQQQQHIVSDDESEVSEEE